MRVLILSTLVASLLIGALPGVASADTRPPQYSRYGWGAPKLTLTGSSVRLSGSFLADSMLRGPLRLQLQARPSDSWVTVSQRVVKARRSGSGSLEVGVGYWQDVPRYRYSGRTTAASRGIYRVRAVLRFREGDEGLFWTALTASRWTRFER